MDVPPPIGGTSSLTPSTHVADHPKKRSKNVKTVGVDLSLSSTGLAAITENGAVVERYQTRPAGDALLARRNRLGKICDAVWTWANNASLVVIEGPSHASTTGHQHDRSGLWWLVVDRLLTNGVPVGIVPPTSRAKYGTGKGNAGKDEVLAAVVRRYPQVEVTGHDEADALLLAAMGARRLGHPCDVVPATHRAALTGATWPPEVVLW